MELAKAIGIVTGASRGIGAHLAEALAARGVDLALAARSEADLLETARRARAHGVRAVPVPADVTDPADLRRLAEVAAAELGPVTLLVNNAGAEMVGRFESLDPQRMAAVVQTNLTAPIVLARLVAPGMVAGGRGHIVNMASAAGKAARPFGAVYAATKHGLVGLSWSLRAELAVHGIGVSVVCPGYVTGVGMFAEREAHAGRAPRALRPVTVERVVAATIAAIERNRAEAVVGPAALRTADLLHAVSVDLALGLARRSGTYRFVKREALGEP